MAATVLWKQPQGQHFFVRTASYSCSAASLNGAVGVVPVWATGDLLL